MNDDIKDRAKDLDDKEHGEGNYRASRKFNDASKEFVQSGKVPQAADAAAPRTETEERELRDAEREGKERAVEEDPMLHAPGKPRTSDEQLPERQPDPRRDDSVVPRK